MSKVNVFFGLGPCVGRSGGSLPVINPNEGSAETITSSGASQATTITATSNDVCQVVNMGSDAIWVSFGGSPTAVAGAASTYAVPAGATRDFGGMVQDDKAAIINDS